MWEEAKFSVLPRGLGTRLDDDIIMRTGEHVVYVIGTVQNDFGMRRLHKNDAVCVQQLFQAHQNLIYRWKEGLKLLVCTV